MLICLTSGATAGPPTDRPVYTFYTGGTRGTYYQFADDIARACGSLTTQVVPTDGSLDNLNHLIQAPVFRAGYRFAFVQNDVLASVFASEPTARTVIRTVMPMYPEDIHILVYRGSGIKTLNDLNAKRVAIGTPGSGVWFTANAIRTQLAISWVPVERSPEESILGVLVGELDAVVVVGGSPIKLFTDMGSFVKDRVTLLNLSAMQLNSLYASSSLPSGTYIWQDTPVELRQTRSMLVAAADVPAQAVNTLLKCVNDNLSELRRWGHPKWNAVQPLKLKK